MPEFSTFGWTVSLISLQQAYASRSFTAAWSVRIKTGNSDWIIFFFRQTAPLTANQLGSSRQEINLHPPLFSPPRYLQQTSPGWIKKKKKASDLSFLLIKRRKWARTPSLCLNALPRCLPPRELWHVNYICYQPRWWLIRYSCLLTMTSW